MNEEYGYGIKITSYDDFCYKYWEIFMYFTLNILKMIGKNGM